MAIHKATLAKEISRVVKHIYPKMTANDAQYNGNHNIVEKLAQISTDIDTANNRAINMSILANGSITADSELIDIRVGYEWDSDGNMVSKVYASAGKAVQEQISSFSGEIVDYIHNWRYDKISLAEQQHKKTGTAALWLRNLNLIYNPIGGACYGNS